MPRSVRILCPSARLLGKTDVVTTLRFPKRLVCLNCADRPWYAKVLFDNPRKPADQDACAIMNRYLAFSAVWIPYGKPRGSKRGWRRQRGWVPRHLGQISQKTEHSHVFADPPIDAALGVMCHVQARHLSHLDQIAAVAPSLISSVTQ